MSRPTPSSKALVLGTRGTPLALAQAYAVAALLEGERLRVRVQVLSTQGDRSLGGSLMQVKGMFTGELTEALLQGEIGAAVHSLKDLPVEEEEGLRIVAIPPRERAHDLLLVREELAATEPFSGLEGVDLLADDGAGNPEVALPASAAFAALPQLAKIGTSSPRRQAGALALRPDLLCVAVRGAVGTRLEWLHGGAVDALILAEAGLRRLIRGAEHPEVEDQRGALNGVVAFRLSLPSWPCAPGQAALAVQVSRGGSWDGHPAMEALDHAPTRAAVELERGVLEALGGGCRLPFAAFSPDGSRCEAWLAEEDWRDAARAAAAPSLAAVSIQRTQNAQQAAASEIVSTLRAAQTAPADREPGSDVDGVAKEDRPRDRVDLFVTSAAAGRLVRLLPAQVRTAAASLLEPRALATPWPAEAVDLSGPRRGWPWVLVSSPTAARILVQHMEMDELWGRLPWCALGEGTARELVGLGVPANLVASARDAGTFAQFVLHAIDASRPLFVPQSDRSSGALVSALESAGRSVRAWPAYAVEERRLRGWPGVDAAPARVLFTSPSQIDAARSQGLELPAECWALGESTAEALEQARTEIEAALEQPLTLRTAASPTAEGVAALWTVAQNEARSQP